MIRVRSGSFLSTAGARWAPAASLLVALLATPSRATDQLGTNSSGAAPTTGVLSLSQLASESTVIAEGVVTRTESLDDDRLRVYHVRVDRTAKGTLDGDDVAVVEIRAGSSRPGLLADGLRAVLLLRPPPPLSYLAQQLPERRYFALSGGRDGIVPIANDAEASLVDKTLTEAMRISTLTDDAEIRAARRALAFTELETTHARLTADALTLLRRLEDPTTLSADEVRALGLVLASGKIPGATRIGIVELIGRRRWKEALPALQSAVIEPPQVLAAVLAARAQLGASPDKKELQRYLASKDPAVRAAAIRAIAALPEPEVGELGRFATSDTDIDVRVAAIEALGASKKPAAVPTLSKTFAEPRREVRQASGRALLAIGGKPASDAFVDLALHGGDPDTRKYAAVLLLVSGGKDSPGVQRLMASNPSGEVREVVEHGLKWTHSHQHDAE